MLSHLSLGSLTALLLVSVGLAACSDAPTTEDTATLEQELKKDCDDDKGKGKGKDPRGDRNEGCDGLKGKANKQCQEGKQAFFDRKLKGLGGNGRSCADCHMASEHFQLSPAAVEKRYQRMLKTGEFDPLFQPLDADDFLENGENASDFTQLRVNGLVRVQIPLPPNVKLIDPVTNAPSDETVANLWRATPSVRDVRITGSDGLPRSFGRPPNATGGYQLDARAATLQEQALGALNGHAQIKFAPPQSMLDAIAAYENTLFTSKRVKLLAEAMEDGVTPLPDTDRPLTADEQKGKEIFQRACAQCHGGPGQTTPVDHPGNGAPRFANIQTPCPRPAPLPNEVFKPCNDTIMKTVRTYEITNADGTKVRRTTTDPGRLLQTGIAVPAPANDDNLRFEIPTLRNIKNTAPYFHNNSADTLDEVLDHYAALFVRLHRINPRNPVITSTPADVSPPEFDRNFTPEERPFLLKYLLTL